MRSLTGKTLFITGGSRGIGRAIALKAAADSANVVIAAKTVQSHAKLGGTIHSVADEIEAAGGKALPLAVDVRNDEQVQAAVAKAVETFGGIDILINNASALFLATTPQTPMKRFDLMYSVNVRGTFLTTKACYPYLAKAENPHVLVLSPPLTLNSQWFADHCAYTLAKYGMSMCVLGMATEFESAGIAVNALWPRTMIETAASDFIGVAPEGCRKADIVADAAHAILTRRSRECTGQFFIDETVLLEEGCRDFEHYSVARGAPLTLDLFVSGAKTGLVTCTKNTERTGNAQ